MNKKELIEKIEALPAHNARNRPWIDKKLVLGLVRELDEPQKVKVPPVVSVWYLINKDNLYKNIAYLCANWVKSTTTDDTLFNWMSNTDNFIEILVKMHQFGYEVEKKKLFKVRLKDTSQYLCNDDTGLHFQHGFKTDFTKEYLEQAGFGWVFNCEGIEIEEVEG